MPDISTEPRYRQIAHSLREQIRSGELAPGHRLPSFPQMRAQGISQNTMEKVYSLLEADGVIERTTGRGIYVAQTRVLGRKPKTGVIGMPGRPDEYARSAYGEPILRGVQDAAYLAGYDVLLTKDFEPARLAKMDGVLWVGAGWENPKRSLPPSMPWVSMLWQVPGIPSLLVDERSGIRDAVRHLWGLGHRRIAYLVVHWGHVEHERQRAYRESLRELGNEADPRWVRPLYEFPDFERALGFSGHGYQRMRRWLLDDWKKLGCTAILAHNDAAAAGILRALREAGLRVPQDVSVVGFDGTETADHCDPPLTTVEVPLREIGVCGVRVMVNLIAGNDMQGEPAGQILPVRLRLGGSTAPPPGAKH